MTTQKLAKQDLDSALQKLPLWKVNSLGKLELEIRFHSFPEAFSFMTRVAFEAEQLQHHPDWSNSYNRVKIELVTHDANGITEKDIELAQRINKINWASAK